MGPGDSADYTVQAFTDQACTQDVASHRMISQSQLPGSCLPFSSGYAMVTGFRVGGAAQLTVSSLLLISLAIVANRLTTLL